MNEPNGPLRELIRTVAGRLLDQPTSKGARLKRAWSEAVGAQLARHTEPVTLHNGLLTVRVDSPAWATELTFLAPEILRRLQEGLPPESLREIRFKSASIHKPPPWMVRKTAPPPRLPAPLPEEEARARALTAPLTDPPLQAAMHRLFLTDMVLKRLQAAPPAPGSAPPPDPPSGR